MVLFFLAIAVVVLLWSLTAQPNGRAWMRWEPGIGWSWGDGGSCG